VRKASFVVFDDYVVGTTHLLPTYTDSWFNRALGKFDRFSFEVLVDNVTTSPGSLDIYVEHSPDALHWLHKNGTADNPPVAGSGDVKWAAGALSSSAFNPPAIGDSGASPLFAFARLQIFFGTSGTGGHIKITATPRDSR
jgi:hypothetical protein